MKQTLAFVIAVEGIIKPFFFLVWHYCIVAPKSRNGYVKFDMHVEDKVGKFHQIIKRSHNTPSIRSILIF